jgi:hypothetical protein
MTMVEVGNELDVDYSGMNTAEIIDHPLLIHKSLMPNGVIDLVSRLWDKHAGGTFFGETKPTQDYLEFAQKCQQREDELKPTIEEIVNELINSAGEIQTPTQATDSLARLSQRHMVDRAIIDGRFDPMVFGEAAPYIELARMHYELGNIELAEAARDKAQAKAKSYSCPGAKLDADSASEDATSDSSETDSKDGLIRCPKCSKRVSKKKASENKGYLCCPKCNYAVEICTNKQVDLKLETSKPSDGDVIKRLSEVIKAAVSEPEKATVAQAI